MADCRHDFVYDDVWRELVCRKCGYVLTKADKQALHRRAFDLMAAEEGHPVSPCDLEEFYA